jgi:hypothetical protein
MRIGDADLRVGSRARFASELERDDARHVTLERQHLQVEHQPCVVGIGSRYTHRAIQIRQLVVRRLSLGLLNTTLHLAYRIQVLIDPCAIGWSECLLKARDIFANPIEETASVPQRSAAVGCGSSLTEQPLEDDPRVSLSRQRGRGRRPREVVLIDARISVIALTQGLE